MGVFPLKKRILFTVKINEVVDLERYLGYIIEWEKQVTELFLPK